MKHAALLVGLVAVVWLAAPTVASSPPEPICGACGSSFEDAARQQGVPITVTHSTAEIQVDPNGSATWVVTNRLNESAASRLAANPERLTLIAREAAAADGLAGESAGSVTLQSAAVENGTARIQFTDPDAGSRHAGVLVVDYFHSGNSWGWLLNFDRLSISGPERTVVGNDPRSIIDDEHASAAEVPMVSEGTVTWQRTASDDSEATLHDQFYIAYAEPETGSNRVDAALTMASLPIWLSNVRDIVLPSAVIYGLVLIGVAVGTRWIAETPTDVDRLLFDVDRLTTEVDWLAAGIAGIGFVGVLLAALGVLPATLLGVGVIYVESGVAALVRPDWFRSVRGALAVGLATLLAVGGILLWLGAVDGRFMRLAPTLAHVMATHLPLAVAPAFGVGVSRRGNGARWSATAAVVGAVAAFIVAGGAVVPFDFRPFLFVLFPFFIVTVLLGLLVLPLSVLAAGLSEPSEPMT